MLLGRGLKAQGGLNSVWPVTSAPKTHPSPHMYIYLYTFYKAMHSQVRPPFYRQTN